MRDNIYNTFEECVSKIFKEAEYTVEQNVKFERIIGEVDVIAEKEKKYCVEIKGSQVTKKAIDRICYIAEMEEMIPVLVTAYYVEDIKRDYYKQNYPSLVLIDIANLLFAVQNNEELHNELTACLPYAVDEIIPKESFLQINSLSHDNYTESLIEEFKKKVKEGKNY